MSPFLTSRILLPRAHPPLRLLILLFSSPSFQVPRLRLCEEINEACAIVEKTVGWPGFLQCYRRQGKGQRFPSSCTNSIEAIQFNTTSRCVAPLISAVSDSDSWYEETECGLQCRDPLFTKSELDRVSVFIFVLGNLDG